MVFVVTHWGGCLLQRLLRGITRGITWRLTVSVTSIIFQLVKHYNFRTILRLSRTISLKVTRKEPIVFRLRL
jgi:hypothetical protein